MLDEYAPDAAADASVASWVTNLIVVVLWLPLVIVLWGLAGGLAFFAYRFGRYGTLPSLGGMPAVLTSDVVLLAVGGGVAYLYLTLATATFGSAVVESSAETAEQLQDSVDGDDEGDGSA